MFRMFSLLLCTLCASAHTANWTSITDVDVLTMSRDEVSAVYNDWAKYFGKSTHPSKLDIFISNWDKIMRWNSDPSHTATLRMNQFGDMSPDEFRELVTKPTNHANFDRHHVATRVPDAVDWTKKGVVPPVKNQGQMNAASDLAVITTLECVATIATGKMVTLSSQELIDCCTNCSFIDGPEEYILKNKGLCSEANYPSTGRKGACKKATCGTRYDAVSQWVNVKRSPVALESAVVKGCVAVGVEADQSAFQFYSSGILSGVCGERIDHVMTLVGYGEGGGAKYWKLQNEWGTSWGEKGYMRICRECGENNGGGECGILDAAVYPVLT